MNSIHADDLQVLQAHKYEPCTQLTQPPLSCVLQGQSPLFQTPLNGLICPSLPNSPSFLKNFTALEWTLVLFKSKKCTVKWFICTSLFYLYRISPCKCCLIKLNHNTQPSQMNIFLSKHHWWHSKTWLHALRKHLHEPTLVRGVLFLSFEGKLTKTPNSMGWSIFSISFHLENKGIHFVSHVYSICESKLTLSCITAILVIKYTENIP